jgi:cell division protein FtsI (penicillin-binding protein 3)
MLRLRFGFVAIAMVVSIFGARLVQLQALDPHAYAAAAAQEGLVEAVLPARRGAILDRNGQPLATSVDGLMVVADPAMTRDKAPELAKFLANRLDIDYFDTREALSRDDTRFAYIARRVPATLADETVTKATELGFQGLATRPDQVRDYPAHDVAANLVGYMGGIGQPLGGLELTFDQQLAGHDGSERYEVGGGNRIPLGENVTVEPQNGKDITTTLDRDLQWYVQKVLAQTVEGASADSGMAVVMDTRTGEVLADADYPTYDADDALDSREEDRGAPSLSSPYEPGSVEKALTMAALIDQGKATPEQRMIVPPEVHVMGETIHDYFVHPNLRLTLTGVLAKSSNIGTVLASRKIGPDVLKRYLEAFGLGTKTGIGARGESAGLLPAGSWNALSRATIAFGQGIAVNAVQMAAAINTIANGGVYVAPSLVEGSATTDGNDTVGTDSTTTHRVVSAKAASEVARMMERVLDPDEGVAPLAAIDGYRVAGKTGTAQVVDSKCGCYKEGVYNVSFAGFAPADKPRFTVYVVIRHPRNHGGGGSVGGPAFQKIMSRALARYRVPPTGTKPSDLPILW